MDLLAIVPFYIAIANPGGLVDDYDEASTILYYSSVIPSSSPSNMDDSVAICLGSKSSEASPSPSLTRAPHRARCCRCQHFISERSIGR